MCFGYRNEEKSVGEANGRVYPASVAAATNNIEVLKYIF